MPLDPVRVGVVGAGGLVGQAALSALGGAGVPIGLPRITAKRSGSVEAEADRWIASFPSAFQELAESFRGLTSVVNAAGLAAPRSVDHDALWSSNAVLPLVVARAADLAGVRRLVHVSSAAVQGGVSCLDETMTHRPLTAYGNSKALGEKALDEARDSMGTEVMIYRATSVLSLDRASTRTLIRLYSMPIVPIFGSGEQPLPIATLKSTARAIAECSVCLAPRPVVLHPYQGVTARALAVSLGRERRVFTLPRSLVTRGPFSALKRLDRLSGSTRLLELLAVGQRQEGGELLRETVESLDIFEELRSMADQCRSASGSGRSRRRSVRRPSGRTPPPVEVAS